MPSQKYSKKMLAFCLLFDRNADWTGLVCKFSEFDISTFTLIVWPGGFLSNAKPLWLFDPLTPLPNPQQFTFFPSSPTALVPQVNCTTYVPFFGISSIRQKYGSVLLNAPRPPLQIRANFARNPGRGAPPPLLGNVQKVPKGVPLLLFCTFLRRGGPPPSENVQNWPGWRSSILIYYYTLLYWGEGSSQYSQETFQQR